jgi:molybdopterin adenylyltransferase
MRAAILTVSSSRSDGNKADESGPALARFAESVGAEVAATEIVPDQQSKIEWALRHYSDSERCDLVLTTGGTGFAPDDVTPEATRAVIEREAPGIAEALRAASREHTRNWMLSRGIAGIRGRTLIINFPGSPKSIGEAGQAIEEAIPHAVALLRDGAGHPHEAADDV